MTGSYDDQLTGRRLEQRIIALGQEVDGRPARQALRLAHSRVLMRQGSAGIGGSAIDIEIQAENLEHTGQAKVERDALRDRWFTAEESRDYGFVDQVLTDLGAVTPARGAASFGIHR
jgi:ATP-dependent protease ClpP protease subunit